MTRISRCHISKGGIDTTVKSSVGAFREFAPIWGMVRGWKNGTLSDVEYTALYLPILDRAVEGWRALKVEGDVTIACYCPNGQFCHTLLIGLYASLRWPHLFEDCTDSRNILSAEIITQVINHVQEIRLA